MTVPKSSGVDWAWMIGGYLVGRSNTATSALSPHHHSARRRHKVASPVPTDKLRHRCAFASQSSRRPCGLHGSRFCFESTRPRRRSVDGSVEWMGVWTGAAARERYYLLGGFTPLLKAACGQLHAALVCSAGRDHAGHYPLARVLPFLQVSFAGSSSLFTFLPPLLIRPVHPHFPQAIITPASSDRTTLNGVMGYPNASACSTTSASSSSLSRSPSTRT
ncbi:hypothetical protein C8J57DRAFT_1389031 [Mycena rebaudengoi]|nr:hypothetical protein C8J57DRAFT_1389031 [Mycena rebaudengoi]